jgi:ComF family protein
MTSFTAQLPEFISLKSLKSLLGSCVDVAASIALPKACCLCQQLGSHWCEACLNSLRGKKAMRCSGCGLTKACDCEPTAWLIDRTLVLADYVLPLDRLITDMKFQGKLPIADALGLQMGQLLAAALQQEGLAITGIPIPLSNKRLRERGFNQAHRIANAMKRHSELLTLRPFQLIRTTQKMAQSSLGREARLENLSQTYEVVGIPPMRVLLIDDVMTTGATLNTCAAALKAAGTREVWAIVAARTPKQSTDFYATF